MIRALMAAVSSSAHGFAVCAAPAGSAPVVLWGNAALARLLGTLEVDLVGAPLDRFPALCTAARRLGRRRAGGATHLVVSGTGDDARTLSIEVEHAASADGPLILFSVRDVTEERRDRERLDRLAHHDPLTGLPNRTLLLDRLQVALARARRYDEPLAVLFVDLDGFKGLNDTMGHRAGDGVLRAVAERLTRLVRASDTVARIGGDEFVIVLPAIGAVDHAERLAQKVVASISTAMDTPGGGVSVSPSVGVAAWPDHGDDADVLLHRADAAMLVAKSRGKGRFVVWNEAITPDDGDREPLLAALNLALEAGGLTAGMTPLRSPRAGGPHGFEIALRWQRPDGVPVSGRRLTALLTRAGRLDQVWFGTLRLAANELGPTAHHLHLDLPSAVASDPQLADRVLATLAASGLPADRLWLEVREEDLADVPLAPLAKLRARGVRVLLDHHGASSQLSPVRLRELPIDGLKLAEDAARLATEDAAFLRGILGLCRGFGLRVLADGVHDEAAAMHLLESGLTAVQGSAVGRWEPLAAAVARRRLD